DQFSTARPRLDLLPEVAEAATQDVMVGRDETRHDGLAQAGAGIDDYFITRAGDRVGGEHHAPSLGGDQPLDDDSQLDLEMIDAETIPVGHRPVGPQRGPTAPN